MSGNRDETLWRRWLFHRSLVRLGCVYRYFIESDGDQYGEVMEGEVEDILHGTGYRIYLTNIIALRSTVLSVSSLHKFTWKFLTHLSPCSVEPSLASMS